MVWFAVIFVCSKTILSRYYSVFLKKFTIVRPFFFEDLLNFWSNNMENALLPQIMENTQPPSVFFLNFRQIAPVKQDSFLNFLPWIIGYYICCCCVFWPLENVSIIGAIWPKISKNKLSGGEIFEIFSQIAPIIQASFLTFFYFFCHVFIVYICVCFFYLSRVFLHQKCQKSQFFLKLGLYFP